MQVRNEVHPPRKTQEPVPHLHPEWSMPKPKCVQARPRSEHSQGIRKARQYVQPIGESGQPGRKPISHLPELSLERRKDQRMRPHDLPQMWDPVQLEGHGGHAAEEAGSKAQQGDIHAPFEGVPEQLVFLPDIRQGHRRKDHIHRAEKRLRGKGRLHQASSLYENWDQPARPKTAVRIEGAEGR